MLSVVINTAACDLTSPWTDYSAGWCILQLSSKPQK